MASASLIPDSPCGSVYLIDNIGSLLAILIVLAPVKGRIADARGASASCSGVVRFPLGRPPQPESTQTDNSSQRSEVDPRHRASWRTPVAAKLVRNVRGREIALERARLLSRVYPLAL